MSANLDTLERVANRLGPLNESVVYVGGAVTELLVTDPGAPEPRVTDDIDAIVEVVSQVEYYAFAEKLRAAGFVEDRSPDAPLCRWRIDGVKVDLMPPDDRILGFSNKWDAAAIGNAESGTLPGGTKIRVVTAPDFVATKLEAFAGRGGGHYAASHDIEDIVAVVDGRAELVREVRASPEDVRVYLASTVGRLLQTPQFADAIPGHLPPDDASQERLPLVMERLSAIAQRNAGDVA